VCIALFFYVVLRNKHNFFDDGKTVCGIDFLIY